MRDQGCQPENIYLLKFCYIPNSFAQRFKLSAQCIPQAIPCGFICVHQCPAFSPVALVFAAANSLIGVGDAPAQVLDIRGNGRARPIAAVNGERGFSSGNILEDTQDTGIRLIIDEPGFFRVGRAFIGFG